MTDDVRPGIRIPAASVRHGVVYLQLPDFALEIRFTIVINVEGHLEFRFEVLGLGHVGAEGGVADIIMIHW